VQSSKVMIVFSSIVPMNDPHLQQNTQDDRSVKRYHAGVPIRHSNQFGLGVFAEAKINLY
jgi:hypothetical protein